MSYPRERYFLLPNDFGDSLSAKEGSIVLNYTEESEVDVKNIIEQPTMPDLDILSRNSKTKAVLSVMQKYPKECALKLTYFLSSCKAIPEDLLDRDFEAAYKSCLINLHSSLPKFEDLENELKKNPLRIRTNILNALFWLFVGLRNPRFIKIPDDQLNELIGCFEAGENTPNPKEAYKISYDPPHKIKQSNILKKQFGYYGCDNSEVFSLLFHWEKAGAKKCFNDKLNHALYHSSQEDCWAKSPYGSVYRTVFVLEYYPHPDVSFVGDIPGPQLSLSLRIPTCDSPNFYHIGSPNHVRISYLLIYRQTTFTGMITKSVTQILDFSSNIFFGLLFLSILTRALRNLRVR